MELLSRRDIILRKQQNREKNLDIHAMERLVLNNVTASRACESETKDESILNVDLRSTL